MRAEAEFSLSLLFLIGILKVALNMNSIDGVRKWQNFGVAVLTGAELT